jgi:RNA polymerase sigma factor (sigma-70 family)
MRSNDREGTAEQAALRLVQQHAAELLRFARRFSHCADDAHDAYQRALEILVRRLRTDPPAQPLPWVRTVLRREALAVRAEREQLVGRTEVDLDRHEDRQLEDPGERAVGHERLRHTAEALRRLKPQEVTALVLRAEGLSYKEIGARTGWSYTRCNRAITEGRRALRARLGAIESGAECARWLPLLSALADGEATAAELADLRPHLRACPACRATLRDFHAAPAQVAALVPPALVALAPAPGGSLLGHVEVALHGLAERVTLLATRAQGGLEALSASKLAVVAASTAAIAGGGAAIEHAADAGRASRAAAQVADAPAAPGGRASLTMIAELPSLPAAAPVRRSRRTPSRSEFEPTPEAKSEFTPHAASAPEFAATSQPSAAPAAPAPATVAASPQPSSSAVSPGPAEFGGP